MESERRSTGANTFTRPILYVYAAQPSHGDRATSSRAESQEPRATTSALLPWGFVPLGLPRHLRRHADTRWRLIRSIIRAARRRHTRVTRKPGFLLNTKPATPRMERPALCGSWGHIVQLNTSCCRPSARAPYLPHAARLGLRNARAESGWSEVRARRAAGRASRTPLAESEERKVADGADPAEDEHIEREPVVQLRHWPADSPRRHEGARARAVPADDSFTARPRGGQVRGEGIY